MFDITSILDRAEPMCAKPAKIVMAMPRYRYQSIADLADLAIWASVSDDVDAKIREQIRAGVFPVRLKPEDWNSGKVNWLFDVIAPDQKSVTSVIANFKQLVKDGDLRLHPLIAKLVDKDTLEKMGAKRTEGTDPGGLS